MRSRTSRHRYVHGSSPLRIDSASHTAFLPTTFDVPLPISLPIRPTRGAVSHHLSIHPDSHPQPQPQPRPIPRRPQVQHLKIEKMQAVSAIEKIWRQRLDDDTRRLRDEMEGLRGRLDRKEEEAAKLLYVNIGNERKISELTKVSSFLNIFLVKSSGDIRFLTSPMLFFFTVVVGAPCVVAAPTERHLRRLPTPLLYL